MRGVQSRIRDRDVGGGGMSEQIETYSPMAYGAVTGNWEPLKEAIGDAMREAIAGSKRGNIVTLD